MSDREEQLIRDLWAVFDLTIEQQMTATQTRSAFADLIRQWSREVYSA